MKAQTSAAQESGTDLRSMRNLADHLPVTVRPSVLQQLDEWEMLFPFERDTLLRFLRGVGSFSPAELDRVTAPLRSVEEKMGVAHWNFSADSNTMENSGQLARSQYYAGWRRAVEQFFAAVDARGQSISSTPPHRTLVVAVLPRCLPVTTDTAWAPWGTQGTEIQVRGDASSICDLLLNAKPSLCDSLAQQGDADASQAWFIDAETPLGPGQAIANPAEMSCLRWSLLDPFRERFLSEMNSIPRDTHVASQTLTLLRQKDWSRWWPAELEGQHRLRNFVVEVYLSGNGAAIFPSAFVEWTAAEVFRRARPRVLIARFGVRNKPKPFTSIAIFENQSRVSALPDVPDPENSAIDAAMLARYVWLSALRYKAYDQALYLCVAERLNAVRLIAPPEADPCATHGSMSPAEICEAARRWLAS